LPSRSASVDAGHDASAGTTPYDFDHHARLSFGYQRLPFEGSAAGFMIFITLISSDIV
jgi:hypothetical protein